MNRRQFLAISCGATRVLATLGFLTSCRRGGSASGGHADTPVSFRSNIGGLSALQPADANGIRLPIGFESRVVARSGQLVEASGYTWHAAPDGGATFAAMDGGWVYVSNSEINDAGGVGALRFDATGRLVDAYPILERSTRNCAGGSTTWGTWLSCEEVRMGLVWECDPFGRNLPKAREALGLFTHEAAAVDPASQFIYLTEDLPDGRLYRFRPGSFASGGVPDLTTGTLEVAQIQNTETGSVTWMELPDHLGSMIATHHQRPESTPFNGGEGIAYHDRSFYFTTKGDNRIWRYWVPEQRISIVYDAAESSDPILTGTDNILVSPFGEVLVAEDGGDMQVVAVMPNGVLLPVLQVEGHANSEVTGIAFSPDMSRLYFSSQRGEVGTSASGITYEVRGPFRI